MRYDRVPSLARCSPRMKKMHRSSPDNAISTGRAIDHCVDARARRSNIQRGKMQRIALYVNSDSCWRIEHGKTKESRHRLGKRRYHSRQESSRVASRWSRQSHSVWLIRDLRQVLLDGSSRKAGEQRTARLEILIAGSNYSPDDPWRPTNGASPKAWKGVLARSMCYCDVRLLRKRQASIAQHFWIEK
jgi:hypothetical protein